MRLLLCTVSKKATFLIELGEDYRDSQYQILSRYFRMHRRQFFALASISTFSLFTESCATKESNGYGDWNLLLQKHGAADGRLGIYVYDSRSGKSYGLNEKERFPMCSTFKFPLAAAILQRVDLGQEHLDRPIEIRSTDILSWAPVTSAKVGASLTIEDLCAAAVSFSDNTAANLLLRSIGGPETFTRQLRVWGDKQTRLDRWEPELNESRPGDVRDTTTPRDMVHLLQLTLQGKTLSESSRSLLLKWMLNTTTNKNRLAAQMPEGWKVASKTGTGDYGSTNDVGILLPPDQKPIFVALYLTETQATLAQREAILAEAVQSIHRLRDS